MRIFLSYGHDNNVDLVNLIMERHIVRDHGVWIDQPEIKFGDDWRRKIYSDAVTPDGRKIVS